MNREQFVNEIVRPRLDKISNILEVKADEYATDGSAFYNFERAAEINQSTSKEQLWGMATKHLVSVIDMIESNDVFSDEYIDEKIGDLVVYLILLEGILKHKQCCGDWDEKGVCKEYCKPTKL